MLNDLWCNEHNIALECHAGRCAHRSNWYCPKCEKDTEEDNEEISKEIEKDLKRRISSQILSDI